MAPDAEPEAYRIIETEIAPKVLRRFLSKGKDYGEAFGLLGLKGQFSDINRKFWKLKRSLWDGKILTHEDAYEICEDMVGHLYLTMYMLRKDMEEDSPV